MLIWAGGAGLLQVRRVPKGVRIMTHFDEAITALGELMRAGTVPDNGAAQPGWCTYFYSEPENKIEEERRLKILSEGVEKLNMAGIEATGKLLKGDAVDKIVEYAHTIGADLIMLGHQHRDNWLERWWAGSIPKALIEHSPCSVLVVIIKWICPTHYQHHWSNITKASRVIRRSELDASLKVHNRLARCFLLFNANFSLVLYLAYLNLWLL